MSEYTRKTTWILQKQNIASETRQAILSVCQILAYPVVEVVVIPFTEAFPPLPAILPPFIFYGYATLLQNAYRSGIWRRGVFFDPSLFQPEVYLKHYGERLLNSDMKVTTFAALAGQSAAETTRLFLRPNDDCKVFDGKVMSFGEIRTWVENFKGSGERLTLESQVVYCSAKEISAEWRLFILEGQVIGASQYKPVLIAFTPPEVIQFGREMARCWSPVPAFVMDVARTGDGLKIVELNCINGSGFYRADVEGIVRSLSRYLEAQYIS